MDPYIIAPLGNFANYTLGSVTIDAAGERVIFTGQVTWAGTDTTKAIRRVVYGLGANTAGTGTTFRVSLADADLTAGFPVRDDGVMDQTWTTGSVVGISTTVMVETGDLSSDRTVTKSELVCVIFDFSVFGSSTSLAIRTLGSLSAANRPVVTSYLATVYSEIAGLPSVGFIFADGTRGTLVGCAPLSNVIVHYMASDTVGSGLEAGDERGVLWTPTRNYTLTGVQTNVNWFSNAANWDLVVYEGTNVLTTVSHDANTAAYNGAHLLTEVQFASPLNITAGQNIRFIVKPTTTTANGVRLITMDVPHIDDRTLLASGQAVSWTQRVDGGAWSEPAGAGLRWFPMYPRGTVPVTPTVPTIQFTPSGQGSLMVFQS